MHKIGVRDIARAAGVSIGTVDRALNGRAEINGKTRSRVLRVAAKLGYEPDPAARALSVGRPNLRIGVCIPEEIREFYEPLWRGIREEARRFRHLGIELICRPVKELASDQRRKIAGLLKADLHALVLTPGHPGEIAPLIDKAERQLNVRVLCVATDDSLSCRSTSISVEPRMNGMLAAELLGNFLPPGAAAAIITGMLTTEDHSRKVEGFRKVFAAACPGGRVAAVLEGHENARETFLKTKALLEREPALAGLYVSTVNSMPVCRALEATGRSGRVKVIATDLFPALARAIERGVVTACIHQRPYRQGQLALRLAIDHFVSSQPLPEHHWLNPAVVMKSNLELFAEAARS